MVSWYIHTSTQHELENAMMNNDDYREYVPEDLTWMEAYDHKLLDLFALLITEPGSVGDDMTYFMHLMQIGHKYEMGEFDDEI